MVDLWGSAGLLTILRSRDQRSRLDDQDPPLLIIHGRDDQTIPFSHAQDIKTTCETAGIRVLFKPFDGGHAAWQARIDGRSIGSHSLRFLVDVLDLEID